MPNLTMVGIRRKQVLTWAPVAVLIAVLAALSSFDVFEQDVFWQIRAGDEIVQGLGLQHEDSWSLTARGRPWVNFQWLATVGIRVVYGLGGVGALIALRVLLAGVLLSFAALLIHRHVARERARLVTLLLLPLLYVTIAFKIEVRSDTFVVLAYAGVLWLWGSKLDDRAKLFTSLALTLVSANLHAGTAPFVALVALPSIWALHARVTKRLGWSMAHILAPLATPYGWRVVPILWEHFAYGQYNTLDNFDHAPLSFTEFSLLNFGIAAWSWIPLAAAGWVGFAVSARGELKARRASALMTAAVGLLLTGMAVNRMRVFPYHLLFFLPFVASLIDRALTALQASGNKGRRRLRDLALWGTAAAAGALLVGQHVRVFSVTYRMEIAHNAFPVGSAEFIRRERPQGNLFHTYGFGGYFVWTLREYPTFVDTRETMFRHMQSVMLNAQSSPEYARRIWETYDINVAVIPTPETRYIPGVGFQDAITPLFPQEQWAIVYYDDISTVVMRRIPAHEAIIRANEFLLLRPHIPATHYVASKSRTPENDARFVNELTRCERHEPENLHCAIAHSAMARLWAGASPLQPARDKMVALERKGERHLPFLVELSAILRATNDSKRGQIIAGRIASLASDR